MTPIGLNVRGRRIIIPKAVSFLNAEGMTPINLAGSGVVAILGTAKGGKPQEAYYLSSLEEARAYFTSGPLVDAIQLALDPSPDTGGASQIVAIRVEAATQAQLLLKKSAATVITLVSSDYGIHCNALYAEAALAAGVYTVGVRYGDLELTGSVEGKAFTIQYTGAGTAATMDIDAAGLITTVTGGPGGEDIDIDWGMFDTIAEMVAYIDDLSAYTCVLNTLRTVEAPETLLDLVAAADIKTTAYQARSYAADIVYWFNTQAGGLVEATLDSHDAPDTTAWTAFTGGTTPAATNDNYNSALTVLKAHDVQLVVAYTATMAVQDFVQAHVVEQSDGVDGQHERIGITGSAVGESVATALTTAQGFNSDRILYTYPGVKRLSPTTGELETIGGWQAAAQIAGMLAAVDAGSALTRRYIKARGIEKALTKSEFEQCLLGGILPLELVRGSGIRVVQSISTWTGSANYVLREVSCRRAADLVIVTVRAYLDTLVGLKGGPHILARATSTAKTALTMLAREEILIGDETNPPFRAVTAKLIGEVLYVSFEANLVVPVNYVVLEATVKPYEGSLTV